MQSAGGENIGGIRQAGYADQQCRAGRFCHSLLISLTEIIPPHDGSQLLWSGVLHLLCPAVSKTDQGADCDDLQPGRQNGAPLQYAVLRQQIWPARVLRCSADGGFRSGVSVTVICPWWVVTEFHEAQMDKNGLPYGPRGRAIYSNRMMSADRCAEITLRAAYNRRREVLMGPGTLIVWLKLLSPRLMDWMALAFLKSAAHRTQKGMAKISQ